MKNIFIKGTMVLFALFVLFAFTGCPDPVNDPPIVDPNEDNTGDTDGTDDTGDTGNETMYTVAEIKIVDKDGNSPSDTSDPKWSLIWYITQSSINSIFDTTFTSDGWDSSSLVSTNGTIPINSEYQELNKAKYEALISSLSRDLDFNQGSIVLDFTASYDSTTNVLTVTYGSDTESDNSSTDTYIVTEINFIDEIGNTPSNSTYPTWSNLWEIIESDALSVLNTAFSSSGWYKSYYDDGKIKIYSTNQELNITEYTELINSLDSNLDFNTTTNYHYDFTATYDSTSESISIRYTASAIPGEGGDTETPSPPSAPTNVTATALSETEVRLTWNSVSNATEYEVSYGLYEYAGHTTKTTSNTSMTISNLGAGATYYIKVRAKNQTGTSQYSGLIEVTTQAPPTKEVREIRLEGVSSFQFRTVIEKILGYSFILFPDGWSTDINNSKIIISSGEMTESTYNRLMAFNNTTKYYQASDEDYADTFECTNATYSSSSDTITLSFSITEDNTRYISHINLYTSSGASLYTFGPSGAYSSCKTKIDSKLKELNFYNASWTISGVNLKDYFSFSLENYFTNNLGWTVEYENRIMNVYTEY